MMKIFTKLLYSPLKTFLNEKDSDGFIYPLKTGIIALTVSDPKQYFCPRYFSEHNQLPLFANSCTSVVPGGYQVHPEAVKV